MKRKSLDVNEFNSTGGPGVFMNNSHFGDSPSHYASKSGFFNSMSTATNAKMMMTGMSSLGLDGANTYMNQAKIKLKQSSHEQT
jgi:hypothetical protein